MAWKLALHMGTIEPAPLELGLRVARETGWDAVELRYVDFARTQEAGTSISAALEMVRDSGLPVAAMGVQAGWLYAEGDERRRLLDSLTEVCRWATVLDAPIVMSPAGLDAGDLNRAVESVREVGKILAAHGKTMALELNIGAKQFNTLESVRELLAQAAHPNVGLLVDTYHIQRGGRGLNSYYDLSAGGIAYFQYSDVPDTPILPSTGTQDRLPPGEGVVPFREILPIVAAKGYTGYLSYEALNRGSIERDPFKVASEGLEASRKLG